MLHSTPGHSLVNDRITMNERVRFIGSLSHYLVAATTFKTLINGYTRLFI